MDSSTYAGKRQELTLFTQEDSFPAKNGDRVGSTEYVYVDSIVHATHLLPVFKDVAVIPREINFTDTF